MTTVTSGKVTAAGPAAGDVAPRRVVLLFLAAVLPLALAALWWGRSGTRLALWWPAAGVAVIAVALAPRRRRPAVAAVVVVLCTIANAVFGRELHVAMIFGCATGLEAYVAATIISRNRDEWPTLKGLDDLVRFLLGAAAGAAVAGVVVAWALYLDNGTPVWMSWRSALASHGAAVVSIAALGLRTSGAGFTAGRTEKALQWALLLVVVALVFAPGQRLPLSFLVFVPLVWGAVRLSVHIVAWQVLLTAVVVTTATTAGWGPFVIAGQPPMVVAALSQTSVLAAALVALPLAMLRAQRADALAQVTSSTDLLDNILTAATATAVIGTDRDGRIEFFNVGAEALTGWRADEVVGRACMAIVATDDGEPAVTVREGEPDTVSLEALAEPLLFEDGAGAFRRDWAMITRHGDQRVITCTISRRTAHGEHVGYLGIAEDVTERRAEESSAVADLEAERELVDRLAQVDRTKNDFMSTVSHELRTPITSIMGYSQLLLSDETGALPLMHRQIVGRIERNGRRLMGLIEDMLTMSQVEVGDFRYTFARVDLRAVVQRAVETEIGIYGTLGVRLRQDISGDLLWVDADADKLERAVAALLDNAAKYSRPGDEVELCVGPDGEGFLVSVRDHGFGISEEDQHHLFDRFYRGRDATSRAIQGAGLGLSVSEMIVDGHGGTISCESDLGEGSLFELRLPRAGSRSTEAIVEQIHGSEDDDDLETLTERYASGQD